MIATNQQVGTYSLLLRVNSRKNINDNAIAVVKFVITIAPWQCTPAISPPVIAPSYTYYINHDSMLKIDFTGVSNNNCNFKTSIHNATPIFTFQPEVLDIDPVITTKFFVLAVPSLSISTVNPLDERDITVTLIVTSQAPNDSNASLFSFLVRLIDNPCVSGFFGVPGNTMMEYYLDDPVTRMSFDTLINNDCTYTITSIVSTLLDQTAYKLA